MKRKEVSLASWLLYEQELKDAGREWRKAQRVARTSEELDKA